MECPSCKHELKKLIYKDVDLDQCLSCGGMWFDGGELRKAKDKEDEFLRWLDIDLFSDPKKFIGGNSTMNCPNDKEPLYEILYDNADIKVDVCRKCQGIWVDKDEYENIVAFLKRMVLHEDAKEYLVHLEQQIKEIVTGPESTVSELLDAYMVFRLLENRVVSQWPRIEEIMIALRSTLFK